MPSISLISSWVPKNVRNSKLYSMLSQWILNILTYHFISLLGTDEHHRIYTYGIQSRLTNDNYNSVYCVDFCILSV